VIGRLVEEKGLDGSPLGYLVCVSCFNWNHWHDWGEPCDIEGCACKRGCHDPVQQRYGP